MLYVQTNEKQNANKRDNLGTPVLYNTSAKTSSTTRTEPKDV